MKENSLFFEKKNSEGKDFHIDKNMFIPLLVKAAYIGSNNKQTQTFPP
jgi:hypothetical protein